MKKIFIKIFSEEIANRLRDGGFSYITEKINCGKETVYIFEDKPELKEMMGEIKNEIRFDTEEIVIVADCTLNF